MRFPDPNVGHIFGFGSSVADGRILVTFLGGIVRIPFQFKDIAQVRRTTYGGGRVSWDVIRWGKCPRGTKALRITMKKGAFREHIVVFGNLDAAVRQLREKGVKVS